MLIGLAKLSRVIELIETKLWRIDDAKNRDNIQSLQNGNHAFD